MTAELTVDFSEPYIGGAGGGSVGPIPPDQIGIDTRAYVLDTESNDYRREGVEVVQQRNATSNRDILLLPQNVWRHQDESWHLGAGQKNRDREDSLQYRFSRSFGIDPWVKYEVSLLNETSLLKDLTGASGHPAFLQVHNGHLYCIVADGVYSWATPSGTEDFVQLPAGAGNVISTTYDGDAIIVLTDAGKVYTITGPTTVTAHPHTLTNGTFIAYVKGYLIGNEGNVLVDITGGTPKTIYTSPVTGFTWVGAAEGPNAIYLLGGAGDKWQAQRVSVKEDGTDLAPAITAATLPDGEIGTGIGAYLGFVFLGSTKGVRMATPNNSSGDLTLGAFIPTQAPVYGFEGQSQFVWITGSYLNPVSDTGPVQGCLTAPVSGLYRADLTSFTVTESTPAYANDLYAVNGAYGTTRSVITWGDKRVFTVDGKGVYLETDVKVPCGWLEPGRVSFSVEDVKTGLYAQMKWEPLRGTVALDLSADNKPPVRVLNWSIRDTINSGNVPLNGLQFSRLQARYVLYRDGTDTKQGPTITRFEVRARPAKGAASRWYLPILNHEAIDLNGVIEARDVNVEFDRLMNLVETGKMFILQEGRRTYQCVAVDFRWLPQKLTEQGNGWQGVYVLIAEEVR